MLKIRNSESRAVTWRFALCVLILACIFTGCDQVPRQEKEDKVVLAVSPDAAMTSVPSDFAAKAIKAAGGLNAWTKTKEIHVASVVTLYQPGGSHHLSELQFAVYPWSNSIQVSATEPEGKLLWQLSNGRFKVLQGDDRIAELPEGLQSRDLAEAVLSIVTAPARLLDQSADFAEKGSPIKVNGQWHQPIERLPKSGILAGPHLSGAVFYQNRDNSLIDMIQFESAGTGKVLTVRGYDYSEIEKGGAMVPDGIEIFTTDSQAIAKDRLIKIDSHKLEPVK